VGRATNGRRDIRPIEPFREFLVQELAERRMNLSQFAEAFDLPEKTLRGYFDPRQTQVEVMSVDRVLTAIGVPWLLEEWYPLAELQPLKELTLKRRARALRRMEAA